MRSLLLASLFFLGFSFAVQAAKVSGRITDEDGLPLAFASVLVKGTSIGTSANADGNYILTLPEGKYTLQAQYIGYKQTLFDLSLTANETLVHNFMLLAQGYELKEMVVKSGGEDPAYRIIRNAIGKRSFHLKQMQSFQTSIYLKGVFRNRNTPEKVMGIKIKEDDKKNMKSDMGLDSLGKGVLYLCEELADYYTTGNKEKLIIRSVKESGNPNGVGIAKIPSIINFYQNNVNVLAGNDLTFTSPISATALNAYTYKLIGDFEENGRTIYKIKVTPKRKFERCFTGDIYIADEDWAIHSVQLLVTQKEGLDMLDTIRAEQQYIPLGKDLWVIKNQVYYPTITFLGFDISGNFVTVYDNQKVNQSIPDSIFNRKVTVSYQRDAAKKDSAYWKELRPMKLEEDELRNYVYRDSMHTVEHDPKRIDSLRVKSNKISVGKVLLFGISTAGKDFKTKFNVSPLLLDINFNTVEGLNYTPSLSLSHRLDTGKMLSAVTNLRYGFANTHFNAKGSLRYTNADRQLSGKKWSVAIAGGKYISQFNNEQPVGEWLNTYSSLVQQITHYNLYERSFAALQAKKEYGNGFSWEAGIQYEKRLPLQNSSSYSFVQHSDKKPFSANLPLEFAGNPMLEHNALIAKAGISFQPGATYTEYPDRRVLHSGNAPVFTLYYQKGIPNLLNSITDYDKWQFQVRDELSLKRWGSLEYNALIGGFLNDKNVQIPDQKHLWGNQYTLASPYLQSFQLAPYYRFSNTEKLYAELHVEYYLKGLLTNKIPLLRQAHWYFVLGNNTFYSKNSNYYTEAFIGIDNFGFKIFRIFRFDYIQGWDSEKRNYSGFRIGIKSSGIVVDRSNEASLF